MDQLDEQKQEEELDKQRKSFRILPNFITTVRLSMQGSFVQQTELKETLKPGLRPEVQPF